MGDCLEELELAAERVEAYMDRRTGNNAICYQIIGEPQRMPWDIGYITDEDLEELQQAFIITGEDHK